MINKSGLCNAGTTSVTNSEAVEWWLNQWNRDDVLSGNEPMSREDVEGLIKANGGTSDGLNLAFRNLNSANLSELNLRGVFFHPRLRWMD